MVNFIWHLTQIQTNERKEFRDLTVQFSSETLCGGTSLRNLGPQFQMKVTHLNLVTAPPPTNQMNIKCARRKINGHLVNAM